MNNEGTKQQSVIETGNSKRRWAKREVSCSLIKTLTLAAITFLEQIFLQLLTRVSLLVWPAEKTYNWNLIMDVKTGCSRQACGGVGNLTYFG